MKKLLWLLSFNASFFLTQAQVNIHINISDSLTNVPQKGRMLIYFFKGEYKPIYTINPGGIESGILFGQDINRNDKNYIDLQNGLIGFRTRTLESLDTGIYSVQAIYRVDTTSYRLYKKPNYYSDVQKITISKKGKQQINLKINKQFSEQLFIDSRYARYVTIKSELLSKFWKRDVMLHACVGIPYDYDSSGKTKYPVAYNIGGYGSSCTYYSYYYADSNVIKRHIAHTDENILAVLLDSDAPYGDCYQMNSENNGPYMDALIKELIPAIEQRFHGYGTPVSRFLTGGSTGGWVSLALQIFNPDFFGGCWSRFGDPVDFNFFQLVNIYKDKNAFVNRFGYDNPSMRTLYGEPRLSIRDEINYENTLGKNNSYVFSGDQWGGWNAVYSPRGNDGKPKVIWSPTTGIIDTTVAAHWKRWDLHLYLRDHWQQIGPKLQGKLHIWMGDMDTYYLNNAMRLFQDFILKTENPKSDAEMIFGAMQAHGYDPLGETGIMQQMMKKFEHQ